jgi:tRNA threonylcarbamoyladenosine biosynthesis protein TsaE
MEEIILPDAAATEEFGRKIAPRLRTGDIVKITGPLGAGKTTLVRGLVAGLGGEPGDVHSPTFSLVHEYRAGPLPIIHCDFYRLPKGSEMEEFGGLEFFEDEKIYLIEWFEQTGLVESINPRRLITVDLEPFGEQRKLRLRGLRQIVD